MERDVVPKRNQEASELQVFIVKSKKRLQAMLKRLHWNEENVLKNYNSNSCTAAKLSVDDTEPPLPESFTQNNSIFISKKQFREIVADPEAEMPQKFTDLQRNFSRQQKLQIYEHVVKHTDKLQEPELTVPIHGADSSSMTFAQIVAIKRRDRNRKRRKYRTSKPTHIEEVRNLVELQMQALAQYLKPSRISDTEVVKESRLGQCKRRSRSRGKRSRSSGRRSRSRGRRSLSKGKGSRSRERRSNSRCSKRRTPTAVEKYSYGRRKENASESREVKRSRRYNSRDRYYRSKSKEIRSRRRSKSREKRYKRSRSEKRDERKTSNREKYSNNSKYDKKRSRSRSNDRSERHRDNRKRDKKDSNNNKGRSTEEKNRRYVEIGRNEGRNKKLEKEKEEIKVKVEREVKLEKEIEEKVIKVEKEADMISELTFKTESVYEG